MAHISIGNRLPAVLSNPLFGKRSEYGLTPDENDPSWIEWLATYKEFYEQNQKRSIGKIVNDAGYRIMRQADLNGSTVLEVGAGIISHLKWWQAPPKQYIVVDIDPDLLSTAASQLKLASIPHETRLTTRSANGELPLPDNSVDAVISFYSLEHLYPLKPHLMEMRRVLRPGGILIGAIPAEGGLAWGTGRYLTSRRWLLRRTNIDPDKIICWEHPNFANEVLDSLDELFDCERLSWWPLGLPSIDLNLVISFEYRVKK